MGELTFITLEDVRTWGVPVELDGISLTLMQARVLAGIVEKAMDEAGHPKDVAVRMSVAAFRAMYEKKDEGWQAVRNVRLAGGKASVRNKFHKADERERIMARVRSERSKLQEMRLRQRGLKWVALAEAGARHGKADKGRIFQAIEGLFGTLDKGDAAGLFGELRKKLGLSLRFRKGSGQAVDAGKSGKEAESEGAKA